MDFANGTAWCHKEDGNIQTLAEKTESIHDNCNSRHDNYTTFPGLCSHPIDFGKVYLLHQKHRCKPRSALQSFLSLILKIISRYKMLLQAILHLLPVVLPDYSLSTSAYLTQIHFYLWKVTENHSLIFSNHWFLLCTRYLRRFC